MLCVVITVNASNDHPRLSRPDPWTMSTAKEKKKKKNIEKVWSKNSSALKIELSRKNVTTRNGPKITLTHQQPKGNCRRNIVRTSIRLGEKYGIHSTKGLATVIDSDIYMA